MDINEQKNNNDNQPNLEQNDKIQMSNVINEGNIIIIKEQVLLYNPEWYQLHYQV